MRRKKRPAPPKWWTLDNDSCWMCKEKHKGCGGCSYLKKEMKEMFPKKQDRQNKDRGKDYDP